MVLRRLRQILNMPFLYVKWWAARQKKVWQARTREKSEIFEKLETLHVRGLEYQRLERDRSYLENRGMQKALRWILRLEGADLNVGE